MPRAAYESIVGPLLAGFQTSYPEIDIELEIDGKLVDIAERGLDAGFRYGNLLANDVIAIALLPSSESVLVASPDYLARATAPATLDDLAIHRAIVCRSSTTGQILPWLLKGGDEQMRVDPNARTVAGDLTTQIDLTVRGLGISCAPLRSVSTLLENGLLERVVPAWSVPLEPLYLYFSKRKKQAPALRAFIDFLKAHAVDSTPSHGGRPAPNVHIAVSGRELA